MKDVTWSQLCTLARETAQRWNQEIPLGAIFDGTSFARRWVVYDVGELSEHVISGEGMSLSISHTYGSIWLDGDGVLWFHEVAFDDGIGDGVELDPSEAILYSGTKEWAAWQEQHGRALHSSGRFLFTATPTDPLGYLTTALEAPEAMARSATAWRVDDASKRVGELRRVATAPSSLAPVDWVSVTVLVSSLLCVCPAPLLIPLALWGLHRTANGRRRGRWAALAGLTWSVVVTLAILVVTAVGY